MRLPSARGSFSEALFARLSREPVELPRLAVDTADDDFEVALFVLQELAYRRIEGVNAAWEDEPSVVALRTRLERQLLAELRATVVVPRCQPEEVPAALEELVASADGPSLSAWFEQNAALDHLREFMVHRAPYQLKEADPHSFAIPRLETGRAKTALLEIQLDEYGRSQPGEAHAHLFRAAMVAAGLDPEPSIDALPSATLRTNTALNCLGRTRRLLGACLGHLAVFEMTSVEPMARYAAACRRLLPQDDAPIAARFYDVHVAADGLHGRLAFDELVGGFVDQHPDEATEVLFGAATLMQFEAQFARHLLDRWAAGHSSLLCPLPRSALRPPTPRAA